MKFIQRRIERRKKVLMTLCAYEWQELFIAGVGLSSNKDLRWEKKTEKEVGREGGRQREREKGA